MERRSSKREHRGQHHEPTTHRKPEHHQSSGREVLASGDLKRRRSHHYPIKESLAPALSGDEDYVRRWLAQTNVDIESDLGRARTHERKLEHRDAKLKLQLDLPSFRHAIDASKNAQPQRQFRRKRRHRSSSDSSLLEPILKPEPKSRNEDSKLHTERREEYLFHKSKKRKVPSSDSASLAESNARQETFEKRDRHKTREDRYEPKKKHKSDNAGGKGKPKKKREKKGDKKKASKKASEDLLKSFSSKSVSQNRLTFRPTHGPGLFRNGRASSPARRRGVPDLVFSEMEFLQRPPRLPDIKATSKSRDKDRRRASREQDEISTFFKPKKAPLQKTSPIAKGEQSSTYLSDERSMYIKHRAVDRTQSIVDLPEKPFLEFGRSGLSSDRISGSRGRTPSRQRLRVIPDTTTRVSENTATGVTWSETQVSPGETVASRRRNRDYQHRASPTPEPIRRSIERTGIFRDTGISDAPDMRVSQERPNPDSFYQKLASRDFRDGFEDLSGTIKSATPQSRLASRQSKPLLQKLHGSRGQTPQIHHTVGGDKEAILGELTTCSSEGRAIRREDPVTTEDSQIIVAHYASDLERPSDAPSTYPLRESKSTPINREQIAKDARIKRPANTLPATRVPGEPKDLNVNEAVIPAQQGVSTDNTTKNILVKTAPAEQDRQLVLAKDTETATAGEQPTQGSLEAKVQVMKPSCDDQNFYNHTNDQPQRFSPTSIPAQFNRSLNRGSRYEGDIPIGQSETGWIRSVRPEMPSLRGFAVRGLSRGSFAPNPPLSRTSATIEPEPLCFNQVPRQSRFEEDIYGNYYESNQTENSLGILQSEVVPCLEDNDFSTLGEQDYEAHNYDDYLRKEGQQELEDIVEDGTYDGEVWRTSQGADVMEHYGTWSEEQHGMSNDYELVDDSCNGQAFIEGYEREEHGNVYEEQMAEEEIPLQGFWRPIRLY